MFSKAPSPQLGKAVDLHRTGIGNQNELCPFQHQDPCALREFPCRSRSFAPFTSPQAVSKAANVKILTEVSAPAPHQNPQVCTLA